MQRKAPDAAGSIVRLLHCVPTYLPATRYGGPIRSVHGLCAALAARGHQVRVVTTSVDGPNDSDVPLGAPIRLDGVEIWYYPSRLLRRLYWSPDMAEALPGLAGDADLIHTHSVFLWPTWAAARAARAAGVPYVISPRGMMVKDLVRRKSRLVKSAWITLIERGNLERSAGVHVTSAVEAADLAQFGFQLPPVIDLPNGIALPSIPDGPAPMAEPYVLFLGRVNWKKGLDRLIWAMAGAPDVRLVVAGNDEEGYRDQLGPLISQAGVDARVSFVGSVQGEEKQRWLRHACLLVLPSYSENFGNVVLESWAAGRPVVVTPEVGLAPVVAESGAGVVVTGDPEQLGPALTRMLANPGALDEMGVRGRRLVEERFTWDAVAARMESAYLRILESRGR